MWYTDTEIIYEVKHALNPYQQIGILAELNGVERTTIERILKKHKIPLPRYQRNHSHSAKAIKQNLCEDAKVQAEKERRRREKREYYLRNRERIIAQAKEYQKRRKERERHGKERQKERDS